MKREKLPQGAWRPTRFWTVTIILFALQAGLIWALGARTHKLPLASTPETATRLAVGPIDQGQLATALFAEDPTLFQDASARGYSGRAWMGASGPRYVPPGTTVPEVWLSLQNDPWKPDPLSIPAQNAKPLALTEPAGSDYEPAEIFLDQSPAAMASGMQLIGGLAKRARLGKPIHLAPQPGAQLLSNTVVQVAVDAAGEVVLARLTGNSGSPSADATALTAARLLRFAPLAVPGTMATWGEAIFRWETVEPPLPQGGK